MSNERLERRVLAANAWAEFNYSASCSYQAFITHGRETLKFLVESVIIHDRIILPTENYVVVTALVRVLGQRAVIELLEAGLLRFIRVPAHFAYFPEGRGLVYGAMPFFGKSPPSLRADVLADVKWAFEGINGVDPALPRLVVDVSEDLDLSGISDNIIERTYEDFRQLHLADGLDPEHLPLDPMSFVTSHGSASTRTDEPIPRLLAMATANLEMQMMTHAATLDLATSTPIGHALLAYERRSGMSRDKFATFRQLTGIPDIGELAIGNTAVVSKLLRLRESTAGSQFRAWFHESCAADPIAAARAYVDLLHAVPKVRSTAAKVVRLLITNGVGLLPIVGPIVSLLAGVTDTFVVDRIAERNSATFFVDQVRQIDQLLDA
jgi:hypothetical protein